MTLLDAIPSALAKVEERYPGAFWILARGRVSEKEPLYGFQLMFGTEEVIAAGEGDTPEAAIRSVLDQKEALQ